MASKKKNSTKLNKLNYLLYFAILLLFSTLCVYFYNFKNGLSTESSNWGTFGDFMGGTLNPIFALFSLFAIIYTIKIQTQELEFSREELEATRSELKESRIAQQEQSESLKLQNEATKLQIFENTFFQLNSLWDKTKSNIEVITTGSSGLLLNINGNQIQNFSRNEKVKEMGTFMGSKGIKKFLLFLNHLDKFDYKKFNDKYENYTGAYFGQIYQILKFIEDSNIENKQRYVNIFRAQFTKDELEFLFYHCLGIIGKRKFKKLVEDYELFEHMILNENVENQLLEYDIDAFGKNEIILKRYIELKEKAKTEEIPAFVKAE
jgi:hypothetical protein